MGALTRGPTWANWRGPFNPNPALVIGTTPGQEPMTPIDLDANLADVARDDFESYFNDFLSQGAIKQHSVVTGTVIERHW